jgi:hypothetical protein
MSDIPPFFHSLEHDAPFKTCLTCERDFQEIDDPFTVSKVFKGPECVFEYAMCLPCRRKMAESFSKESRKRINAFFENNPHLQSRTEDIGGSQDHHDWTRHCATCKTPLSEIRDYSVACMGFGEDMVFDPFPMMVCSNCENEVQNRLSKSTRDQWDKFILDHFEGPPADALKPDGIPILV